MRQEGGATTGGMTGWPLSEYRQRKLEVQFTGSGSEYFRIWIVNLLLTAVTLSLYWPFAKTRRLKYFYANTLVDGQALSFHGNPWTMFRGHVLMLVLFGAYSAAQQVSPVASVVAMGALIALWPALWRAGLQFRMANTSWRGLRFSFDAPLAGAYQVFLPMVVPAIAWMAVLIWFDPMKQLETPSSSQALTIVAMVAPMLGIFGLMPLLLAMAKRYQHRGYRLADQHGDIELSNRAAYRMAIFAFLISLGLTVVVGAAMFFAAMATSTAVPVLAGVVGLLTPLVCYGLSVLVFATYFKARWQNLVWNGTSTEDLQFRSALHFPSLLRLSIKNLLLTIVTLGLFRPFAVVSESRLRLESVSISLDGEPDLWVARQQSSDNNAAADFAGDFFGLDMGL